MMNKSNLHPLSILAFFGLFLTQNASAQTYCASKGNTPWTEWIATVQIGTLTNASQKEGYGNFLNKTTDLAKGSNYTFNLTKGYSWEADPANATQQGRVWIDYNQNGTFEDSEIIISFTRNTNTGTVTIPTTATTGTTRMRVSLKTIGVPTACETFDKGEVEDYTVNITGSTGVGQADLTFGTIISPSTVRVNEPWVFSCRFKNIGTAEASTAFSAYGYAQLVRSDGTIYLYPLTIERNGGGIPAGFDSLYTLNSIIPPTVVTGNYTLRFIADPDNRITESNENNNVFNYPISILPATTDNSKLKITNVTGPTLANPNTNLPLSITIKNEGTVTSFPDSVFLAKWRRQFFGGGSYPSNYAPNSFAVPAIPAGGTVTVNANFALPASLRTSIVNEFTGEPYLILKSREKEVLLNTPLQKSAYELISYYYPIQPSSVADLGLTATQLTTTWDSLNNNIDISLTVTNNGPSTAQNVNVNVDGVGVTNSSTTFNGTAIDKWVQLTGIGTTSAIFTDFNSGREENGIQYTLWKIPQLAAGASATATFRGKAIGYNGVPQYATYYYKDLFTQSYILYADARDNNRTNDSTAKFRFRNITYVENRNTPDLTLTNLTIPTPSVQQGQNLNFNVDFKNVGTGAATGNFTVKSYLSVDQFLSADDYQNGVIPTANYAAGQAVLQVAGAMNVSASVAAGTYFLILKIDADDQITETNENNNTIVSGGLVTVTTPVTNGSYCASKGNLPWNEWIAGVQFANLNNTSQKEGYGNFTNLSANVTRGVNYPLTITQGYSWAADPSNALQQLAVWIDYNKNNVFESSELVATGGRVATPINVNIPTSAVLGTTRMRVSLKTIGAPTACETFDRGEVEDYSVNITGAFGIKECPVIGCRDTTIVVATGVTSASVNIASLGSLTGNSINCTVTEELFNNVNNPLVNLPNVVTLPVGLSTITHSVRYLDQITLQNSVSRCDIKVTILQQTNNNQPDLTLNNFTAPSYSAIIGQTVNFKIDAKNIGTAAATGNFTIKSYLSRDRVLDASDYQNGTVSTGNYAIGANNLQVPISMTINSTVATGFYFILIKIDADNQITESDETNNVFADNSTINVSNGGGNQPDLTLSGSVSPNVINGQSVLKYGNVYLKNTGLGTAIAPFTVNLYLSTDATLSANDPLMSKATISANLLAGDSVSVPLSAFSVANNVVAGNYFFIFKADGDNAIAESSEANNTLNNEAKVVNPNLSASFGTFPTIEPNATVTRGDQFNLTHFKGSFFTGSNDYVRNDRFGVKAYLSTDTVLSANDFVITDITEPFQFDATSAGFGLFTTSLVPASFTSGAYYIVYELDNANTVLETNETDNKKYIRINWVNGTVVGGNQPDLTITNLTIPTPSVQQGQVLSFKADLKNIGTAAASGNFTVKSYLSTDNVLSANDYADGVVPTGNYAAGFTVTQVPAAMTVNSTLAAGQYYLILKIDADNQVTESNESNNIVVSTGLITVTGTTGGGGSDIALSLTTTPSVYRQYTTQNFRITATNSGTTAFSNVKIKFTRPALTSSGGTKVASIGTFQDYCPGGIECSEWTIPTLAGGATATLDAPIFILAPTGAITATAALLSSTPTDNTTANNTASVTVNSATAPITQPLVVYKPTQLIPVVIQKLNPTLVESEITLELESLIEKTVDFGISNSMGQTVLMQQIPVEKGMNKIGFNVSQLPQGLYFIQTNVGKGRNVPTKFIKL
jgi:subtilase family serine protease